MECKNCGHNIVQMDDGETKEYFHAKEGHFNQYKQSIQLLVSKNCKECSCINPEPKKLIN